MPDRSTPHRRQLSWIPTNSSRQPLGNASSRAWVKARSSIDISSITSRSSSRGRWRCLPKPRLPASNQRWRVLQGNGARCAITASPRRRAALPVGAAKPMRRPGWRASARARISTTVLVLPVPGPPLSSTTEA